MTSRLSDLALLQQWLQQALISPQQGQLDLAEEMIEASSRQSPLERLAVYQRSYYARLQMCMREQFPALCYALGESLFDDFTREYLQAHPSESYTLYDLGKRLPHFLQQTRPDKSGLEQLAWVDFMIDLSHFECTVFALFDAQGSDGMKPARPETDDSLLALQPAIALGDYRFPVAEYYHAVRRKENPALPPLRPSRVALVRKEYLTQTMLLSPAHSVFLSAMMNGMRVDQALQQTAEQLNLPLLQVRNSWRAAGGIRERWIAQGVFVETDAET